MATVTRDHLLDMHAMLVTRYGGRMGVTSNDILEAVVATPHHIHFGAHRYPGDIAKMSALVYALVKRQPFQSNNETTALLALLWLCHHNGFQTSFPQRELCAHIAAVHSESDDSALYTWLCEHLNSSNDIPF